MQKFQYPYLLHLLWLLIPMILLSIWYFRWRRTLISNFVSTRLQGIVLPHQSEKMLLFKTILSILTFIVLIIGIANPQIGVKQDTIKGKGAELMILLDVSNSMMAQDIQPNRLERAKLFISKLLDHLHHDRVGFIIFAGNAFLQVPITIDYSAIKMSLPQIDPSSISSQGTSIGEAVNLAQESLGLTDTKNKGIIIITDGEDNDGEAENAIADAKKNGIKVLSIGVGSEEGATIPMGNDVKRDENGAVVKTAFNRKMLENLASIGNGTFYHLGQQSDIVEDVVKNIEKIESKEFEEFDYSNYNSYFYYFLMIALVILFITFILPNIPIKEFIKKLAVFALIMLSSQLNAQTKEQRELEEKNNKTIRKGNTQYNNKKFQEAEVNYRKALSLNPKDKTANYNLANALYEQGKHKESIDYFSKSISSSQDKTAKAKAFHNLGNAHFKSNNTEEAIKAYENALKLNPNDMDTKFNLALAKKKNKNEGGGGGKNNQQNQKQQQDKKDSQGKGDKEKQDPNGQPKPDPKDGKDPNEGQGKNEQGEQPNQPQPKPGAMSKEQADKLLEALKNQEQNTQNKVQRQKPKPEQKSNKKDW